MRDIHGHLSMPPAMQESHQQSSVDSWFLLRYALAFIGLFMMLLTPVVMTLAVRIGTIDPVNKGANLGFVLSLGAFVALIVNPLCGMLSDRTYSRFGRRRPWLIGGSLAAILATLVIATTNNVYIISVAWCFVQVALNGALAALYAIVPDQIPTDQRGKVSAVAGMSVSIGTLCGTTLVKILGTGNIAMFAAPAVVGAAGVLLLALTLRDPQVIRPANQKNEPHLLVALASSFWVNPLRFPDFGWAWVSRFMIFIGKATLLSYQVYFLIDYLGIENAKIADVMFKSTLITAACVILSSSIAGWASDLLGRRKVFVFISAIIYGAGLAILVFSVSQTGFFLGIAVSSVGYGVYLSIDQALVVDILPNRDTEAAKNMGVMNIANVIPQSLAPAIAPFILALGDSGGAQNYGLLFLCASIAALAGALAILPVRGAR